MEVEYIDHMGTDLSVVNAARVSFHKKSDWVLGREEVWDEETQTTISSKIVSRLKEGDVRLIKYLAREKHFSPFNHTGITLKIKAPIFVARQLQKHKFMPWNEVSRRYVDEEPEFYMPEVWREKADNVKQGSSKVAITTSCVPDFHGELTHPRFAAQDVNQFALDIYRSMVEAGVCAEQARMVLPQSMYTEWYWTGTLGAWADMYKLRIDSHTQYETQQVAAQCGAIISNLFPVSWEALTGSYPNEDVR